MLDRQVLAAYTYVAVGALLALVLEWSLLPLVRWQGAQPDLLLVLAVVIGLDWDERHSLGGGALAGFIQDLFRGQLLGVSTGVLALVAWAAAAVSRRVFIAGRLGAALLAAGASVLKPLLVYILLAAAGRSVGPLVDVGAALGYVPWLNALAAVLLYRTQRRLLPGRGTSLQ